VVIKTDQTNKGISSKNRPIARMLKIVLIKFIAPKIEDTPAKCKEKIAQSTEGPECARLPLRGGYTVQPVPAPASTTLLKSNIVKAGIRNQNLMLFSRGNAMSGAPIINGTNQLPKPPIRIGITIKKIIINAWAVTTTL
jgi:hypothetical protein